MHNPVFERLSKVLFRSAKIYILLMIYSGLLFLTGIVTLLFNINANSYDSSFRPEVAMYVFYVLAVFQNLLVAFIVPAFTASAISGEKEKQTFDLLILTKMSPFSIVTGKLLSSLLVVALLIVSSLPVFSIVSFYGEMSVVNILGLMFFTLLFAAFEGSLAILFSSFAKRSSAAMVGIYVLFFLLTAGNLMIFGVFMAFRNFGSSSTSAIGGILLKFVFSTNPVLGFMSLMDSILGLSTINGLELWVPGNFTFFQQLPLWVFTAVFFVIVIILSLMISVYKVKSVNRK